MGGLTTGTAESRCPLGSASPMDSFGDARMTAGGLAAVLDALVEHEIVQSVLQDVLGVGGLAVVGFGPQVLDVVRPT